MTSKQRNPWKKGSLYELLYRAIMRPKPPTTDELIEEVHKKLGRELTKNTLWSFRSKLRRGVAHPDLEPMDVPRLGKGGA